jgi:hypothetical protein
LALANVAAMPRPQGGLLSSSILPDVPGAPIQAAGATSATYSQDPDGGDRPMWRRLS